ncbi:hypothetical protein B484DRAFT_450441 [Ochromonadaceae sp. CCMP2298]|nr:hypothetical protein B484DRAFT_450441 [Ochromonadaceae sp. CCMP2298]
MEQDTTLKTFAGCLRYVSSTQPIGLINKYFYKAFRRLILALAEFVMSVMSMVLYLALFCAKISILIFPHAVKYSKAVYVFHSTQLGVSDLIVEFLFITILVLGIVFRKKIRRVWRTFINQVSTKSKKAAAAAPHVLFFGAAFAFTLLGRRFLMPLTSTAVTPLFTLALPLLTTAYLLRDPSGVVEGDSGKLGLSSSGKFGSSDLLDDSSATNPMDDKMLLWVIIAIYHGLVTALSEVPFSEELLVSLPYIKEMVMVVVVWAQLSPVFSRIVFDALIYHLLVKLCEIVPVSLGGELQSSYLFSALKVMNLVSDAQLLFLQALFQDSIATLLALFFIFMGSIPYVATLGMVIITLLLPAFRTAAAVGYASSASSTQGTNHRLALIAGGSAALKRKNSNLGEEEPMAFQLHWLNYWVCFSALWLVRIYFISIWPSLVILLALYLQHSYFRGASVLCMWTYTQYMYITVYRHESAHESETFARSKNLTNYASTGAVAVEDEDEECGFDSLDCDPSVPFGQQGKYVLSTPQRRTAHTYSVNAQCEIDGVSAKSTHSSNGSAKNAPSAKELCFLHGMVPDQDAHPHLDTTAAAEELDYMWGLRSHSTKDE